MVQPYLGELRPRHLDVTGGVAGTWEEVNSSKGKVGNILRNLFTNALARKMNKYGFCGCGACNNFIQPELNYWIMSSV